MNRASVLLIVLSTAGCASPVQNPGAPATATPQASERRWSIVSDQRGGVWRIDTETGVLDHCTLGADLQVHCWDAPVKNRVYYDSNGNPISR